MINISPSFLFILIGGIVFVSFAFFLSSNFGRKIDALLFRQTTDKKDESELVCPQCGSTDWTFPNPLKPALNTFNHYYFVNNFYGCRNCEYIGVFFLIDQESVPSKPSNYSPLEATPPLQQLSIKWQFLTLLSMVLFIFSFGSLLMAVIVVGSLKRIQENQQDKENK